MFFVFSTFVGSVDASQSDNDLEDISQIVKTSNKNAPTNLARYDVGEELIFTVVLDRFVLGELIGVTVEGGVAFDLNSYFEVLDFPITQASDLTYSGWFINEDYNFQLSVNGLLQGAENSLNIKGQSQSLKSNEFVFADDILFISEASLTRMLGIGHKVNYARLEIDLLPTESLPLQTRLNRERKNIRSGKATKPTHPDLYRGYELLSPQVFDFLVSSNYRESADSLTYNYSLFGSRDIALLHTDYYLFGNQNDGLSSARLKFSKQSINGGLLGFMDATSAEVGDVRPVRQAFGQSGQESRGFRVSNAQLRNGLDNQSITLEGPVQAGWDAELYRNGVLIDRDLALSTGQYVFLDVPLIFGVNEFEVVLYGPQGQKVIEKYTKAIDKDLLTGGKWIYDFSFNQINESLLGIGDFGEDQGFAFSGGVRKNIYDSVAISTGILSQSGDTNVNELNVGVDSILFDRAYVSFNSRFDDLNNQTLSLDAKTQIFNQAVSLRLSNSSFGSEGVQNATSGQLSMSGGIPIARGFGLSYENVAFYQEQDSSKNFRFINRLGFNYKKIRIFHSFETQKVTDAEGYSKSDYIGALSLDSSIGPVNARLTSTYTYDNSQYKPIKYQGNFSWHFTDDIKARLNISHDVISKTNRATLQTGLISSNVNLSTNIGFSDTTGWDVGLSARFTLLGQDSEFNSVHSTDTSSTQRGTLAVRVFEDLNTNAIYDFGEPLLENVKIVASQTFSRAITNADGIAVIEGVPNQKATDILVDTGSLPDPFMVPLVPGVSIVFRKGLVDKLDYPVSKSSEIEGLVTITKDGEERPGKRITVLLKNNRGQVIKTTETEFDGYYLFDKVIPGKYTIEIPKGVFEDEDTYGVESLFVKTDISSELLSGNDFSLVVKRYSTGFAATHGNYSNLKMLEVAKRLLQAKLKTESPRFFYSKSASDKRYTLISRFSEDQNVVTNSCLTFALYGVSCKVESLDIQYSK